MRVLRLDLIAFGPFTAGRLDFAKKPEALQLIYGPNEAGKSTTLRALTALLYGIPPRTGDAHLHDMTRLRVGALLQDHRGRLLSLTRRKGAKHTLLDEQGEPTSDGALKELLLGIDEAMFRQMFGLDHQRLREGGEALLAGSGNLGEGLFDASVGTRALRELKEALKAEAEALYKPRGKTPKLNLALDAFRETSRKKREAALSPQAFVEQTRALSAAKSRREACLGERRAVLTERARIERELRLLPLLARHAQLGAELKQLSAPQDPRAAENLAEERMRELERRYGAVLAFEAELPRAQAEQQTLTREIEALRGRLGAAATVEQAIDTPLRTRWRKLADAHGAAERRLAELRQELLQRRAEADQLEQQLQQLAAVAAPPGLLELVAQIEREDISAARARSELELTRKGGALSRGLGQLGVAWAQQRELAPLCERLANVRVPEERELLALEQREQELERSANRSAERKRELVEQKARLCRSRDELLAQGELSSPVELARARAARDAVLLSLGHEPGRLAECRLEVERVDALADKLLREALRSAEVGRLDRELAQNDEERAALAAQTAEHAEAAQQLATEIAGIAGETGLAHASLRALRPKLAKLVALRESAGEVLELCALGTSLGARECELSEQLARQLAPTGTGPTGFGSRAEPRASAALEPLVLEAKAVLRAHSARTEQEAALGARQRELNARRAASEQQIAGLAREQAETLSCLRGELEARGFPPQLGHDEALACLDDLVLLGDAERRRAALTERVAGAEAQRTALLDEVAALVARVLPELGQAGPGERLAGLGHAARSQRESRRDTERLRQELSEAERELAALGDGADLEALRARARELEPHALRARLLEIETQLASLEEEVGGLDQSIGGLEVGLSRVTEAEHAVPVAEELEAELANVRALTRRYLEVRLSLSLLAREVERHRAAHQGPLVSRASALFSSLTLGRYTGLSVELAETDEPLLCALSAQGKLVRVAGLSDGTRDQLYLSLRIASIERFLAASPALPLVLDDAFIHFDDARAEVALASLAELSKKTQVLFFTHHARMVEIAKRALKPSQLALHELDPARGTVAFRDNGPLFADA